MTLQHALTCPGPDVHVQYGVTKNLATCRNCHAEVWTERGEAK